MAGDWIKMRGALLDHPKVIAMSRVLQQNRAFREWVTPGGGGDFNGQLMSHIASRAVTTALLLCAWSAAREHGKFIGDDLWLEHSLVEDMDQLAGAPGIGLAMEAVGWVMVHPRDRGVILPNFKEFNVPMTEAERAKSYRDRKKVSVTKPSRMQRDENSENVTTRVEKRRVVKEAAPPGASPAGPVFGEGLSLLVSAGVKELHARQFLGMLLAAWEERDVIDALTASVGKQDPRAYAKKILQGKPKRLKPPPGTEKILAELRRQHGDAVVLTRDQKAFWHPSLQMRWSLSGERLASV